ncbi:hypothetical protein U9M48_008310, partial [Paspalum notatum var. saurae]
ISSLLAAHLKRQRTVAQALNNRRWVADIQGALTLVDDLSLQQSTSDQHTWKLTNSGLYTSKSAYNAFFLGSVKFAPWKRIWKSWAPLRCKFFLWLAVKNRCWTADRLLKHGLPHLSVCLLCDQENEDIQHILVACVFSWEVWAKVLIDVGLQLVAPQPDVRVFSTWWCWPVSRVPKESRKGFNSLVIMVAWTLWKHRNACVFEGLSPSVPLVCREVEEESKL